MAPNSWNDEVEAENSTVEQTAEHQMMGCTEAQFDIALSDQAVADKEAEEWATLWQESTQYVVPEFDHVSLHANPFLEEGNKDGG